MFTLFRCCGLLAIATVSLVLPVGATASRQSSRGSGLPTLADARVIVNTLWSERETALSSLDKAEIDALESASAKQQDDAYIGSVQCRCEPAKPPHFADRVILQIPTKSVQPVFFAQVHTTNAVTHEPVWYVLAVERNAGAWKLAFINLGGSKVAPPLQSLTHSSGYTATETAQLHGRMTQLANASVKYAIAHNALVFRTDYGATIHRRVNVDPSRDGIYGLRLPSDQILSCFTLHAIDTYSLDAGPLEQGPAQSQWGHLLAPGSYRSITSDTATPMCVAGKGIDDTVGVLRFNYEQRVVATSGIPQ